MIVKKRDTNKAQEEEHWEGDEIMVTYTMLQRIIKWEGRFPRRRGGADVGDMIYAASH